MSDFLIALCGLAIGIFGAWLSLDARNRALLKEKQRELETERQRYADRQQKEYAAERDFNHLKRNYEQLQHSIDEISSDQEKRIDKLELQLQRIEILVGVASGGGATRRAIVSEKE